MDHHYSLGHTPVSCGLWSRSTADSDPQFFSADADGSKLHLAHINLRSSDRMCPAEKQTMQLQARAACASAMHVNIADPFPNGSNTCGIPRTRNLKIRTPLLWIDHIRNHNSQPSAFPWRQGSVMQLQRQKQCTSAVRDVDDDKQQTTRNVLVMIVINFLVIYTAVYIV